MEHIFPRKDVALPTLDGTISFEVLYNHRPQFLRRRPPRPGEVQPEAEVSPSRSRNLLCGGVQGAAVGLPQPSHPQRSAKMPFEELFHKKSNH